MTIARQLLVLACLQAKPSVGRHRSVSTQLQQQALVGTLPENQEEEARLLQLEERQRGQQVQGVANARRGERSYPYNAASGTAGAESLAQIAARSASGTAWDERFVIASSETGGQVVYIPLGKHNPLLPAHPLVESALQKPLAVAVDGLNALLYVADSVARKVFRFRLAARDVDGEAKLSASADGFVAENVEAVGVAVDSAGGVYFVDGGEGKIYKADPLHVTNPILLYDGGKLSELNGPGQLYVDNFHVYWANQSGGLAAGTIVRAPIRRPDFRDEAGVKPPGLKVLTSSYDSARSVCAAGDTVFFTTGDGNNAVYRFAGALSDHAKSEKTLLFKLHGGAGVGVFVSPKYDKEIVPQGARTGGALGDFLSAAFAFAMASAVAGMAANV
eukprot:g18849.t1